jgi:hypothetical protein
MFWIEDRRIIISTPFHLEAREAALAAVSRADESEPEPDAEAEEALDGEPPLTRLFWARVFIVSRG